MKPGVKLTVQMIFAAVFALVLICGAWYVALWLAH